MRIRLTADEILVLGVALLTARDVLGESAERQALYSRVLRFGWDARFAPSSGVRVSLTAEEIRTAGVTLVTAGHAAPTCSPAEREALLGRMVSLGNAAEYETLEASHQAWKDSDYTSEQWRDAVTYAGKRLISATQEVQG